QFTRDNRTRIRLTSAKMMMIDTLIRVDSSLLIVHCTREGLSQLQVNLENGFTVCKEMLRGIY
ncbi:MAG: hypothetical protein RLP02_31235, partial [Coleofasciculus sp. C2-GNP5-27]